MSRTVYVNGLYKPYTDALVHAEDRGFQFADSVYEVIEVRNRALIDQTRHLKRLERSLDEIGMQMPMSAAALRHIIGEVIRRNRVTNGTVYAQVTRGAGPRDFAFPSPNVKPSVVVIAEFQATASRCAGGEGDRRCHNARLPLAAVRHQIGHAAAGVPRKKCRQQGRWPRGLAGGRQWICDGGGVQ